MRPHCIMGWHVLFCSFPFVSTGPAIFFQTLYLTYSAFAAFSAMSKSASLELDSVLFLDFFLLELLLPLSSQIKPEFYRCCTLGADSHSSLIASLYNEKKSKLRVVAVYVCGM